MTSIGLHGRVACSKPFLTPKQTEIRFVHSKNWIKKTKTEWEHIIFSDETKINLFGSDGRIYVRRKNGTRLDSSHLGRR